MDNFFRTVSQFSSLSVVSKQELSACLRRVEFPKGKILIRENTIGNFLFFVESGLARTFFFKDGKDVTDWFSAENSFACSVVSFITREPDRRSIELLEASVLYTLHFKDIDNLCVKYRDIETFFRRLENFSFLQTVQKLDALHFSTSLERYQNFMATHPTIIQRAPLGMIASYLGVTQETLSRIRSQI